jgi:hypothetical protein
VFCKYKTKKEFTKKQHRYICHMMNHSYEENNKSL